VLNTITSTIISIAQGEYGLKRFFRDGYKTAVEDPNRPTYYSSELKVYIMRLLRSIVTRAVLFIIIWLFKIRYSDWLTSGP
jgi:hypothetical protein